jgi:hypothetical protein
MAYSYPDTRDQRRIANSDSKTLLQNWVEEVCDAFLFALLI